MISKAEIKFIKGFLISTKMSQKEFAKAAGISERTMHTALNTGKVSDKTFNKIFDYIAEETIQLHLIKPEEDLPTLYVTAFHLVWAAVVVLGGMLLAYWLL